MKHHMKMKHIDVARFKCELCDFKTNWNHALTTHIGNSHGKPIFECKECGKSEDGKDIGMYKYCKKFGVS